MNTKPDYKVIQKEHKRRKCLQYSGPKNEREKKTVISEEVIYGWDKNGVKKLGIRHNGKDYAFDRIPANKKERKKREAGLEYRDKKGKIAKDERE